MKTGKTKLLPDEATTHRRRTGRPFVTLSYAQSLDGCIAARPGQPFLLSGPESLKLTHQLRAAHEAILVGIGTVLADDPRLTVRGLDGPDPQPVIVDSRLRFPLNANLLQAPPYPWIFTTEQADPLARQKLEAAGASVWPIPASENRVDLTHLTAQLGALGIDTLMVEGGAGIITSFLSAGLVDRVIVTIAPVYLGGLRAVRHLEHPLPLRGLQAERLGKDLILSGDMPPRSA